LAGIAYPIDLRPQRSLSATSSADLPFAIIAVMSTGAPIPRAVLELIDLPRARVEPLDARGHPWLVSGDGVEAVLRRSSTSYAHVSWLHRFLERLATTNFPAPRPLPLLNGASLAVIDGEIWETVSFLPGRAPRFDIHVPLTSAGALLARFHQASLAVSPTDQRPDALPMEACHPLAEPSIVESFHRDLIELDHRAAACCVLHGDCTLANLLVDEHGQAAAGMIDFALAHLGPPESDISFALWVNGRAEQPNVALDVQRVRAFVTGYHRARPLRTWAVRAIPLYLVGRGLQMRVRMERAGVHDELQLNRVRWLHANRALLEDVVASAIGQ
jgi:Ser/Thr protein kinase RdoA (MazF antagonist)